MTLGSVCIASSLINVADEPVSDKPILSDEPVLVDGPVLGDVPVSTDDSVLDDESALTGKPISDGDPVNDEPTSLAAEWWDDPSLPWRHKPTKNDLACFAWISVVAIYAIAMLPLRPTLLAFAPQLFGALGHYTGMIMTGALAAVGDQWWPLVWAIGCLGMVKFDWVYWWAGKLWGRNMIEIWSGKSQRARRRNERAERFARKYETVALIVALLPIPLPAGVIFVVLGAAGTPLRKFLAIVISASVVFTGGYLALGYAIGEPAVELVSTYSRWLLWASVAILVGMIGWTWWKGRSQSTPK